MPLAAGEHRTRRHAQSCKEVKENCGLASGSRRISTISSSSSSGWSISNCSGCGGGLFSSSSTTSGNLLRSCRSTCQDAVSWHSHLPQSACQKMPSRLSHISMEHMHRGLATHTERMCLLELLEMQWLCRTTGSVTFAINSVLTWFAKHWKLHFQARRACLRCAAAHLPCFERCVRSGRSAHLDLFSRH